MSDTKCAAHWWRCSTLCRHCVHACVGCVTLYLHCVCNVKQKCCSLLLCCIRLRRRSDTEATLLQHIVSTRLQLQPRRRQLEAECKAATSAADCALRARAFSRHRRRFCFSNAVSKTQRAGGACCMALEGVAAHCDRADSVVGYSTVYWVTEASMWVNT